MWMLKSVAIRVQGILVRETIRSPAKKYLHSGMTRNSGLENIAAEVRQFPNYVRDMRRDGKEVSLKSRKVNTRAQEKGKDVHNGSLPLETLMVVEGSLNGKPIRVLKDDGCNTNAVSREFLKFNSELFKVVQRPVEVMHSEYNTVEKASEVILGAELRIGTHVYTSNWVLASCR